MSVAHLKPQMHSPTTIRAVWPLSALALGLVAIAGAARFLPASAPPVELIADNPRRVATLEPVAPPVVLTAAQRALKSKLEAELPAAQPTHRITLRNHRVIECQIVDETPALLKIREGFGYSGCIIAPVTRDQIASIERLPAQSCELTTDDVLLAEAFPAFHFVKLPPYAIVTDAPYADVERTLGVLADLRMKFERQFAALIRRDGRPLHIQIVFFSSEKPFREYVRKSAPGFADSAGFYSARENRLVLLNQLGTGHYTRAQERIADGRRRLAHETGADPDDLYYASTRLAQLRSTVTVEAKALTERLIRHEGAHQLVHTYGIESPYVASPTWLAEGLAQYCETGKIGDRHETQIARFKKARRAGTLLPLNTLLNHRDPAGFFVLGADRTEVAYAESWALVYFLMNGRHHDGFCEFIKYCRDLRSPQTPPLTTFLKTDLNALETEWLDSMSRL